LLLIGANGAGKTTLLEAIYLAATGRSFRAARLEGCMRRGGDAGFRVEAHLGAEPRRELALAWSPGGGRERTLDGRTAPLGEHLAVLPLLVWTEAESALVLGPPALRRRFFDRGLAHLRPSLLEAIGRYQRALAEKRALLATGGNGLTAWNQLLARHGAEIVVARRELASAVGAALGAVVETSGLAMAPVELVYRPAVAAALDGEEALLAALEAARRDEIGRRRPLVGPHRDEFELRWDGAEARRVASAGERKLLGLFVLAALGRVLTAAGREPALLLDDADAELDSRRLAGATAAFSGFSRLLASSSRPAAWPADGALTRVEVGALSSAAGAVRE
jgi:DNA replication and repair protein RecF